MKNHRSFIAYCEMKQIQEHLLTVRVVTKYANTEAFQTTSQNVTYT